jgi:hypothetical protein
MIGKEKLLIEHLTATFVRAGPLDTLRNKKWESHFIDSPMRQGASEVNL